MRCKQFFLTKISSIILFLPFYLHATDLRDIDRNLAGPLESIVYFLLIVCLVLALGFSLAAIFLFKRHRENPVQASMSQVIFTVLMSLMSASVPIFLAPYAGYDIFASSSVKPSAALLSSEQRAQQEQNSQDTYAPSHQSDDYSNHQVEQNFDQNKEADYQDNEYAPSQDDKPLWEDE